MADWKIFRLVMPLAAIFLISCAHGLDTGKPELNSDGLRVNSILYSPSPLVPGKRYPGIVLNHGGWDGAEFQLRAWGREMCSKGFVVIIPQFRGQGGSEGKFEFAHGEVKDSIAALEYLKSLPYVDTDRIGMVGYSLGGLVTLRAAERVKGLKALVIISAISDPVAIFKGWKKATPDVKHVFDASFSPLVNLDKIDAPVLVMHGELDRRVSVEQSRELYRRLLAAGKEVKLKTYPYVNHGILWYDAPREEGIKFLMERLLSE